VQALLAKKLINDERVRSPTSLDGGTIDAGTTTWAASKSWKWQEVDLEKVLLRFSRAYDGGDEEVEIMIAPPAEKQRLTEKLLPTWQEWLSRNEAAGKSAREVHRTYVDTMKKHGQPVLLKPTGLYQD